MSVVKQRPGRLPTTSRGGLSVQRLQTLVPGRGTKFLIGRFKLDPGDLVGLPAFSAHLVENHMKSLILATGLVALTICGAWARESCDAQAAAKNLHGAAKTSFVNKCKRDACEPKAVSKKGKSLSGAAKNSFMKSCERGA